MALRQREKIYTRAHARTRTHAHTRTHTHTPSGTCVEVNRPWDAPWMLGLKMVPRPFMSQNNHSGSAEKRAWIHLFGGIKDHCSTSEAMSFFRNVFERGIATMMPPRRGFPGSFLQVLQPPLVDSPSSSPKVRRPTPETRAG